MANLEEIVAAAAKVFQTKGYHAATVQDIADAVGILKGSLYHHHVKSKEDLLYLIVEEPIARIYERMAEIVAGELPAGEKLRRAILAHLEARRVPAGPRYASRLLRPARDVELALQVVRPSRAARRARGRRTVLDAGTCRTRCGLAESKVLSQASALTPSTGCHRRSHVPRSGAVSDTPPPRGARGGGGPDAPQYAHRPAAPPGRSRSRRGNRWPSGAAAGRQPAGRSPRWSLEVQRPRRPSRA